MMDLYEIEQVLDPQISADGEAVVYVRQFSDPLTDASYTNLWQIRFDGSEHQPLTVGKVHESTPRWSPDGTRLLFLSDRSGSMQIHVRWLRGGETVQVTRDAQSPINPVWSADGTRIAYAMRVPEPALQIGRMPDAPPGSRWAAPPRITNRIHFRNDKSGDIEPGVVQLFVVAAEGGTPRQVTSGTRDHPGQIVWSPDGKQLLTAVNANGDADRHGPDTDLFAYDVASGSAERLTDRRGPDNDPAISPNGRFVAYTGFDDRLQAYQVNHLYVMDLTNRTVRTLGDKLDRSLDAPRWSTDGGSVYARFDDQGTTMVARFALDGSHRVVAQGVSTGNTAFPPASDYSVSRSGRVAISYSRASFPSELAVFSGSGTNARVVTSINADLSAQRELAEVEQFWFRSAHDGRSIQGWIAKPPGFDPSRKYPLILEIHGGPISHYGDRFDIEKQLMAAHGYLVLYVNYRGSTGYGEEFGNLLYDAYPGPGELADLLSGVDAVVARGYVDAGNLFVSGGSAGGTLSAWAIAHTSRFRGAAVLYPVVNWTSLSLTSDIGPKVFSYYFTAPPWKLPDAYRERSVLSHVENVRTPTVIISGDADLRTPIAEAEQLYGALRWLGVDTALVRYPDESHGIRARVSHHIGKLVNILGWFDQHRLEVAEQ
jgi:dipeptidyl aminopeptidase/acylaminoacyl peptidase